MKRRSSIWLICTLLAATSVVIDARADADVVVSIKPIHSLVAAVMRGAGEPHLIIDGVGSPHTYNLKPSDAAALEGADAVFWIGHDLETFLQTSLTTLAPGAQVVELSQTHGLSLLENREAGLWLPEATADHDHDHDEAAEAEASSSDHEHGHEHGRFNMHLWLDPHNASAMAAAIVDTLISIDPDNGDLYTQNGIAVSERLTELDTELSLLLAPIVEVPFIVFHDAYQYLEQRYGLHAVGSVTVSPDRQPGADRLRELQNIVRTSGAVCAFVEPQFKPALVDVVVEGSSTRTAALDPLGAALHEGPELYFELMRANAKALSTCLSGSS
jgi:zinc transport system substrate-binding protein